MIYQVTMESPPLEAGKRRVYLFDGVKGTFRRVVIDTDDPEWMLLAGAVDRFAEVTRIRDEARQEGGA